ncbi:MAG: endolytic transglycosylase MltG [Gammaproteobacteria bacterium]|nr:endolytic transglycosylase MltG [Gammaproteobacteria bacterium]MBA3730993.1 endolytic transglycosylase MltG [Gammaproteobacteria bacterium]
MKRGALVATILGVILFGGAIIVADAYLFLNRPALAAGRTVFFDIPVGASFNEIAQRLARRGLLTRYAYWIGMARLQGKAQSLKAGEYRLQGPLTPQRLLDHLVTGTTRQFSLTLVEGWTFKQVMDALARHPRIEMTVNDPADVMTALGEPGAHPEGWFFPDTYYFPRGTTDIEFLRRSHESMRRQLAELWDKRDPGLPLKTPYEALILASIVEKETATRAERPIIAGVFIARLDMDMRLQTDPTIVYGLSDSYGGDIRSSDLRGDTPYNTYIHKGLTPTPIAMPSGASLAAVLHPATTDALFFVAKPDGSHHFSATYDEHRAAVIEYQVGGDASRYGAGTK